MVDWILRFLLLFTVAGRDFLLPDSANKMQVADKPSTSQDKPSPVTAARPFSLPAVATASTPSLASDGGAVWPGPFPDRWRTASPCRPAAVQLAPCLWPSRRRSFIRRQRSGTRHISGGDSISRWGPHKSASHDKYGVNLLLVCTSVSLYNLIHNFWAGLTTIIANLNSGSNCLFFCNDIVSACVRKKRSIPYLFMVTSSWHCAKIMANAYHLSSVFYTTLS